LHNILGRAGLVLALLGLASAAPAQSVDRIAIDSAVSVGKWAGGTAADRPDIIIDVTAAVRVGRGWTGYVRPWFRQPSSQPTAFVREIYQAAMQYERAGRIATRVDLGYILSPIGLGMMDMRPDTNPVVSPHLSYLVPMPPFDPGVPSSTPIASSYPLGGQVTFSTKRWDTRAAVVSAPPNRGFVLYAHTPNPRSRPMLVVGGGLTPVTGVRVGVGYGRGDYATAREVTNGSGARQLEMLNVEAEVAFGYTKIAGELTRDTLSTSGADVKVTQWFVQGMQTLTPRWFASARHEGVNAPRSLTGIAAPTLRLSEAAVGYRLANAWTLRGSVASRKTYFASVPSRQAGMSIVWAQRWR
jgi:hypothetical protein